MSGVGIQGNVYLGNVDLVLLGWGLLTAAVGFFWVCFSVVIAAQCSFCRCDLAAAAGFWIFGVLAVAFIGSIAVFSLAL